VEGAPLSVSVQTLPAFTEGHLDAVRDGAALAPVYHPYRRSRRLFAVPVALSGTWAVPVACSTQAPAEGNLVEPATALLDPLGQARLAQPGNDELDPAGVDVLRTPHPKVTAPSSANSSVLL